MPSVSWFAVALQQNEACIGTQAFFQKQTPYSRTIVKGANGALQLRVYVNHASRRGVLADATLNYQEPWHGQMCHSLRSAYGKSAFWEHYGPDLLHILQQKHTHLLPLNVALLQFLCSAFQLPFVETAQEPSTEIPIISIAPYYQPFGGFIGGLSAVDILMNLGPQARPRLMQATK